jgi:hypothetical protein
VLCAEGVGQHLENRATPIRHTRASWIGASLLAKRDNEPHVTRSLRIIYGPRSPRNLTAAQRRAAKVSSLGPAAHPQPLSGKGKNQPHTRNRYLQLEHELLLSHSLAAPRPPHQLTDRRARPRHGLHNEV